MVQAPSADRFPAYPASWYLFCSARELARRPVSRDFLGQRLVAFRTASGHPAVLEASCSHLGADLGRGRVVGETIQCPFHNWEFGRDGRCTRVPNTAEVPAFACQASYPVTERHGFLFFFNGRQPLFPLPFFFGARAEDFTAGEPFRFVADCSWYLLASNGFDLEHFRAVHDRTLSGPSWVDCPASFARRMNYTARVTGRSVFDRLLRRFAGTVVDVTITSWAGPFILVTGDFGRARSYILIATRPLSEGKTHVEVVVFAPRGRSWPGRLVQPLGLWVRRLFTQGFMRDDINRLGNIRYNPHTLIENDRFMVEFFDWLASLPQEAAGAEGCLAEKGCVITGRSRL